MNRVHRRYLVGRYTPKLELEFFEYLTGQNVQFRSILPHNELPVTAIDISTLGHS
jgi:hypothetical protein